MEKNNEKDLADAVVQKPGMSVCKVTRPDAPLARFLKKHLNLPIASDGTLPRPWREG